MYLRRAVHCGRKHSVNVSADKIASVWDAVSGSLVRYIGRNGLVVYGVLVRCPRQGGVFQSSS